MSGSRLVPSWFPLSAIASPAPVPCWHLPASAGRQQHRCPILLFAGPGSRNDGPWMSFPQLRWPIVAVTRPAHIMGHRRGLAEPMPVYPGAAGRFAAGTGLRHRLSGISARLTATMARRAVPAGRATATMGHRRCANDIHGSSLRCPPAEQHRCPIVAAAGPGDSCRQKSGCPPGRRPVRVPFCHLLVAECDRSSVLRIYAAAPLPVLGPGGPALRVGLPSDDLRVLQAPAETAGRVVPELTVAPRFPPSLQVITGLRAVCTPDVRPRRLRPPAQTRTPPPCVTTDHKIRARARNVSQSHRCCCGRGRKHLLATSIPSEKHSKLWMLC